ncbi:MAG: hypothetical protein MHMPM18_000723, partial [Marteilia pararefringens]
AILQKLHKTSGTDIPKCLNSIYNILNEYNITFVMNDLLAAVINIIRPNLKSNNFEIITKIFDLIFEKYLQQLIQSHKELIIHLSFILNQPSIDIQYFAILLCISSSQHLISPGCELMTPLIKILISHVSQNSTEWADNLFNIKIQRNDKKTLIDMEKWFETIFCPISDLFQSYSQSLEEDCQNLCGSRTNNDFFAKISAQVISDNECDDIKVPSDLLSFFLDILMNFIDSILPTAKIEDYKILSQRIGYKISPHLVVVLNKLLKIICSCIRIYSFNFGDDYKQVLKFIERFQIFSTSIFPLNLDKSCANFSNLQKINVSSNYYILNILSCLNSTQKMKNQQIVLGISYLQKLIEACIVNTNEMELFVHFLKSFPLNEKKLSDLKQILNKSIRKIYKNIDFKTLIMCIRELKLEQDIAFIFLEDILNESTNLTMSTYDRLSDFCHIFHENEYYRSWFYGIMVPSIKFDSKLLNILPIYLAYTNKEWRNIFMLLSRSDAPIDPNDYLNTLTCLQLSIDDMQQNFFTIFMYWMLFEKPIIELQNKEVLKANYLSMRVACVKFLINNMQSVEILREITALLPFNYKITDIFDFSTQKILKKFMNDEEIPPKLRDNKIDSKTIEEYEKDFELYIK